MRRILSMLVIVTFGLTMIACGEKKAQPEKKAEAEKTAGPEKKVQPEKKTEPGKTGAEVRSGKRTIEIAPAAEDKSEPEKAEPEKAEPEKAELENAEPEKAELEKKAKDTAEIAAAETFKHLELDEMKKRLAQYAPVKINWDKTLLNPKELELVRTLIRAGRIVDHLFWLQSSPDGIQWRKKLARKTDPVSRELFHYLMINYGAYDRLAGNEPFLGDTPKPKGANYYPLDMTKEEMEKWITDHPDQADAFKSNFTIIRRDQDGGLKAVPYSEHYKRELEAAARLLKKAAGLTDNKTLKAYLETRADGFLSDDYFASDMAWMDLDSNIEVTIGPYEVYEDHMFGYKAAFEAFITVKDPVASQKLDTFKGWLEKLEHNLPIPDEHKNFKRGKSSPMFIVDVIYTAGDTRAGVQTIAFNLPNDERVREQKGSKKVMLRNIGRAKFQRILTPIAGVVLQPALVPMLNEEAYSNHTLLHEISHGLGPGSITVAGKETTVNLTLKEIYPHLEEAKADILGLYNAIYFADNGVIKLSGEGDAKLTAEENKKAVMATFVAGIFRSTRFGVEEAHGKANLLLFNYLVEKGGITFDEAGKVGYDFEKMVPAVKDCAHELLMIQAVGDYEAGAAFIAKYGKVSDKMDALLKSLTSIPIDIEPIYDLP